MRKAKLPLFAFILASSMNLSLAQNALDERASQVEKYKTVGGVDLKAWVFNPREHRPGDKKAAIVFFFGGGWRQGNPSQFSEHCEYFAARGMVAMTVDYRVLNRHGVKANECVADAKSALRWLRGNADRLGVDPNRIVAGGGSAGGHLAAATALLPKHDDPLDDSSLSAEPNALALFNPALVLAKVEGHYQLEGARAKELPERLGADPVSMSPYHHIRSGVCPTIIFHGKADTTVAYETARLFDEAMDEHGNRCDLIGYPGKMTWEQLSAGSDPANGFHV